MTADRLDRLGTGVTLKTITTVAQVAVGLGISILLNRVYGKDTYGLLVLVYSVTGIAFATCDLGAKLTLVRHVPALMAQHEYERAARLFAAALLMQLAGIGLFVAAILFVAQPLATQLYRQPTLAPLLWVGGGYVAALSLQDFAVQTFQALQNWRREASITMIFAASQLAAAIIVAPVLHLDIAWVLIGHAAACALSIAFAYACLPSSFRRALRPSTLWHTGPEFLTIARFGLPLTFQGVYRFGVTWVDKLMLGPFITPGALAMYYIASSFLNAVMSLFKVLPTVFAPHVATLAIAELATQRRQFGLIFRWFAQVAVIGAIVVYIVVEPIVPLIYGPGYEAVVPLTRALMIVFILRACRDPFALFLTHVHARVRVIFVQGTVLSVATIVLTVVLVPLYQTWGAIAASAAGNVIVWCVMLTMSKDLRAWVPMRAVWVTVGLLAILTVAYLGLRTLPLPAVPAGALVLVAYIAGLHAFGEIGSADVRIALQLVRANRRAWSRAARAAGLSTELS